MKKIGIIVLVASVGVAVGFWLRGRLDAFGENLVVSRDLEFNSDYIAEHLDISARFVTGDELRDWDRLVHAVGAEPSSADVYLVATCRPKARLGGILWRLKVHVTNAELGHHTTCELMPNAIWDTDGCVYSAYQVSVDRAQRQSLLAAEPVFQVLELGIK